MKRRRTLFFAAQALALLAARAWGQEHQHGHPPAPTHPTKRQDHRPAMQHEHPPLPALYGPYRFTRESSGTAWQPESAPHAGTHAMRGEWSLMLHGFLEGVHTGQGGERGAEEWFGTSMFMGMATRPLGVGRLGLRSMVSLDPITTRKRGYPLLLQTGETGDGKTLLVDRQHPHDLFMELAGSFSIADATRSAFLYAGLPGEPALGPPVFMHRFSGDVFPEAPIGHHWLDSTHISYGVVTLGAVQGDLKLETSLFKGREPDEKRYDVESPKLDSHSFRASWNPGPNWALQGSFGRLHSPEQLTPEVDTDRTILSAICNRPRPGGNRQATFAWGQNRNRPGNRLDAFLLEGALARERHTWLGRIERVEKDELFPPTDPRSEEVFIVSKLSGGYAYDLWRNPRLSGGLGALGTVALLPSGLTEVYGDMPFSGSVFLRAAFR